MKQKNRGVQVQKSPHSHTKILLQTPPKDQDAKIYPLNVFATELCGVSRPLEVFSGPGVAEGLTSAQPIKQRNDQWHHAPGSMSEAEMFHLAYTIITTIIHLWLQTRVPSKPTGKRKPKPSVTTPTLPYPSCVSGLSQLPGFHGFQGGLGTEWNTCPSTVLANSCFSVVST